MNLCSLHAHPRFLLDARPARSCTGVTGLLLQLLLTLCHLSWPLLLVAGRYSWRGCRGFHRRCCCGCGCCRCRCPATAVRRASCVGAALTPATSSVVVVDCVRERASLVTCAETSNVVDVSGDTRVTMLNNSSLANVTSDQAADQPPLFTRHPLESYSCNSCLQLDTVRSLIVWRRLYDIPLLRSLPPQAFTQKHSHCQFLPSTDKQWRRGQSC